MSFFNSTETDLLALLFNATAIANVADNAVSAPLTQVACALHTSDPGEAGDLSSSEATYGDYARVDVDRDSGGFAVGTGTVSPVADITFPAGVSGSGTITHISFGKTGGGAAQGWISGAVSPTQSTGNGITPVVKSTTTITLD